MFKRIGLFLSLWALLTMAGGHWALLQVVAWSQMIVSYSESAPLLSAVEKTFDGKNPCSLCLKIQKEKKKEKTPAPLILSKLQEIPIADLRLSEQCIFYPSLFTWPKPTHNLTDLNPYLSFDPPPPRIHS